MGFQLGIFKTLTAAKIPMSVVELSKPTGSDPKFVGRVTRYLAAHGMIKETAKQTYAATKATETLADEAFVGAMEFFWGVSYVFFRRQPVKVTCQPLTAKQAILLRTSYPSGRKSTNSRTSRAMTGAAPSSNRLMTRIWSCTPG